MSNALTPEMPSPITPESREVARLRLLGLSEAGICDEMGLTKARLKKIVESEEYQEHFAMLQRKLEDETIRHESTKAEQVALIEARLHTAMLKGVGVLERSLDVLMLRMTASDAEPLSLSEATGAMKEAIVLIREVADRLPDRTFAKRGPVGRPFGSGDGDAGDGASLVQDNLRARMAEESGGGAKP